MSRRRARDCGSDALNTTSSAGEPPGGGDSVGAPRTPALRHRSTEAPTRCSDTFGGRSAHRSLSQVALRLTRKDRVVTSTLGQAAPRLHGCPAATGHSGPVGRCRGGGRAAGPAGGWRWADLPPAAQSREHCPRRGPIPSRRGRRDGPDAGSRRDQDDPEGRVAQRAARPGAVGRRPGAGRLQSAGRHDSDVAPAAGSWPDHDGQDRSGPRRALRGLDGRLDRCCRDGRQLRRPGCDPDRGPAPDRADRRRVLAGR